MDRRDVLRAVTTAGAVTLAGCAGGGESEPGTENGTADGDESTSAEPSSESEPVDDETVDRATTEGSDADAGPDLSVRSFAVTPAEVTLGEQVRLEVEVENTGGDSGHFYGGISISRGKFDFEDPSGVTSLEGDVAANETRTFSFETEAASIGTWRYHMEEHTATFTTVPPELALGESYVNARDVSMTVEGFELKDHYVDDGEEKTAEGKQFLLLEYTANYSGDGPQRPVGITEMFVVADGERYDSASYAEMSPNYTEFDVFEPMEPGETRTGYMGYRIPADLDRADVSLLWSATLNFATKQVYWHR